ncbi:MAG: hypothetical protein GY697_23950 [Desulfobacterales bacterium]|nr:hypothetical protein [Desulfobacterales bacterium]
MKPTYKCDIMIVGSGPAGISTWLHLKKLAPGLAANAVLIEKAALPRHKLCAGGVGAWSQDVLDFIEVDLEIPALSVTDVDFRYRDERWIYHSPTRFRMVQRADFDFALAKAGVERGMVLHENEKFIEAARERDSLVVVTSRGKYTAKALVGADGSLSTVRRAMLRPHQTCLATTLQVSAPVNPEHDPEFGRNNLLIDFTSVDSDLQGYTWHCPCLLDEAPIMNHGIGHFRFHPERPRPDMKQLFRRELESRQIDKGPELWSSHPIRWYSDAVPISQPNLLLVGDAAGIEPAFGGGIHMALSYGEIAAGSLIRAFRNKDFTFRDYPQAVTTHFMGRHIRDCTRLAQDMYSGKVNPLTRVRQFFTGRFHRPNLLSLLLGAGAAR